MSPEQLSELYNQYFYYILAAGIAIGLLLGAVPLILGIRRKKRNLGIGGFLFASVAGAFSPILSFIVALVFTILIVRKSGGEKSADANGAFPSGAPD